MQITLTNLRKVFGDKVAVDIPSFTIDHGDILGLVGNNGAGKTTLFRLLLDLLRADDGTVLLTPSPAASSVPSREAASASQEAASPSSSSSAPSSEAASAPSSEAASALSSEASSAPSSEAASALSSEASSAPSSEAASAPSSEASSAPSPEASSAPSPKVSALAVTVKGSSASASPSAPIDPAQSESWKPLTGAFIDDSFLIDFLTPEEYLDFIARVNGLPAIDWEAPEASVIAPFIPFTGGEVFGQKKLIRDLSAGNKQKVGIISALFTRPELLILDEPFNFLDPSGQNILKHLLLDYHAESGATILISSHNLQHTVEISTRIALLESGRIIEDLPNHNASAADSLRAYFER